MLIIHTKT